MSTRRTRSGTRLRRDFEPRRLRQTPSRKQHHTRAVEAAQLSEQTEQNVEHESLNREKSEPPIEEQKKCDVFSSCYSPQKVLPSSERRNEAPSSNIWKQSKNDLGHSESTDSYLRKDSDKDTAYDKQENVDSRAATRKPEILVSLLESESTNTSALFTAASGPKAIFGSKPGEAIGNASRQARIYSLETVDYSNAVHSCGDFTSCRGRSSHSVNFFPRCDYEESDGSGNFLQMNEIPGEPFLVSLSKDKNKELSMVKTSSGTVRVGSALRTLVPYNHACHEHVKRVVFSSPEETKTMKDVASDYAQLNRNDTGQCLDEARVHMKRMDRGISREMDQSTDESRVTSQPYHRELDSFRLREKAFDDTLTCTSNNVPTQSSFDYKGVYVADSCQKNTQASNVIQSSSPSESRTSTPHSASQYPLMEEILTDQNYGSFSPTKPKAICLHQPLAVYSDDGSKQVKKTVSLLKTSASLTSLPTLMSESTDYKAKSAVKRSERIRSKSGASSLPSVPFHQSVISTMKPADKKGKLKSKAQAMKKKAKMAMCKKASKKNGKKRINDNKKSHMDERQKDFSKAKATMSREVMDAIVQSIEETVSRARTVEQSSDPQESTSGMSQSSTDVSSTQNSLSNYADNSNDSYSVDQWSDSGVIHDEDDANSTVILLNPSESKISSTFGESICNKKILKTSKTKRIPSKSKKTEKISPDSEGSTQLKGKASKSKVAMSTVRTTNKVLSSCENTLSSTEASANYPLASSGAEDGLPIFSTSGKRFRKKTRKAEEAFGDYDVFCEEDWPVKKSKTKKRYISSCSDTSGGTNQRRPRRSSQMGGLMADPVLEEHAFILWASENRSQLEQQHPGATICEVDAILSSRWCDVIESVKARFFFRAREAFSDDDRHMIRSSTMAELESGALGDFFSDRDPVYIEFIRLPRNRQRDLLRKWLKFFQKILPKKEYIEFIITFKRACGRDGTTPTGRPKRTRMRSLDPCHYKMLFDMIRLTKPRVLDVYRDKKGKEKKMVSDTYSLMLRKLVNNEPWRHLAPGCRSQMLTEILQDLQISDAEEFDPNTAVTIVTEGLPLPIKEENGVFHDDEDCINCDEETPTELDNDADQIGTDLSLGESDYSVLNTDLALSLLSGLNEMTELAVLDQFTLDQVFLAPPRISVTPTPQRRAVSLYSRRLDTPPPHLSPAVGFTPCSNNPHRLLPVDSVPYPKMNIHYPPTTLSCSGMVVHHLPPPPSTATLLQQKYISREIRDLPPCRNVCCRKDSPMDMHTYSISMENLLHCPNHIEASSGKCMNVHPKIMSPQNKMSPQTQQIPISSRLHQQAKLHPRVVPVSCGFQNRFPTHMFSSGGQSVLEKLSSHHMYHMGTQSSAPSSSARLYPQPIGLNSPSPLITSLSPLRNIKYNGQGNKMYSSQCQLVPRMHLTGGTIGHSHRRTAHTIPISTTLKPSGSRTSCNLHQIKVCLPTQALKIPIAKLRGARKTSYVKGKMKNLGLQPGCMEPFPNPSCSQPYQYTVRASGSVSLPTKVLSVQLKNEADHYTKSFAEPASGSPVLCSKPCISAFYGSSMPLNAHTSYPALKSSSQVQLVSVKNGQNHSTGARAVGTTQTAVVVSPMTVHRNSLASQSSISSSAISPCICPSSRESNTDRYDVTLCNEDCESTVGADSVNLTNFNANDDNEITKITDAVDEDCDNIVSAFECSSQSDRTSEDEIETQFVVVGTASAATKMAERFSPPPIAKGDAILCRTSSAESLTCLFRCENGGSVASVSDDTPDSKSFSPSIVLHKTGCKDSNSVLVEGEANHYAVKDHMNDTIGTPTYQSLTESILLPSSPDVIRSSLKDTVPCLSENKKSESPTVNSTAPSFVRRETSLLPSPASSYDKLKSSLYSLELACKTLDPPVTHCLSQLLNTDTSALPKNDSEHCLCTTCIAFGSGEMKNDQGSELPETLLPKPTSDQREHGEIRNHSLSLPDGNVCLEGGSPGSDTTSRDKMSAPAPQGDDDETGDLFADQYNSIKSDESEDKPRCSENRSSIRSELERGKKSSYYQGMSGDQNVQSSNWPHERSDPLRSGLHILAETATSARSLLSSRRLLRPAGQKKCFSDESSTNRKPDLETGMPTMKMTITVQPDAGCILVESLPPRDKAMSQMKSLSSADAITTASTLSVSGTATTGDTCPASGSSAPPPLGQSPNSARKRVLSPNHKKRAHYVHEYLPT